MSLYILRIRFFQILQLIPRNCLMGCDDFVSHILPFNVCFFEKEFQFRITLWFQFRITLWSPTAREKMCGALSVWQQPKVGVGRFRRGLISQPQDQQSLAYTGSMFWAFANIVKLTKLAIPSLYLVSILIFGWRFWWIFTDPIIWHPNPRHSPGE